MSDANAALVAFVGVLVGGYFNNFLGEDFRRFRDGQALAGALAGELKSHGTSVPVLQSQMRSMLTLLNAPGGSISMVEDDFDPPTSPVFEAGVARLGLLGPALAEEVTFVYEQIRAVRIMLRRLSKYANQLERAHISVMLDSCLTSLANAQSRGDTLVAALQRYAVTATGAHGLGYGGSRLSDSSCT